MPYASRKMPNKPCYRVYNRKTKRTFAKCTSKRNSEKQLRLLRALEYNKLFVPYARMNTTRKTRKMKY
jgi:hypothetical protein